MKLLKYFVAATLCAGVAACAGIPVEQRIANAESMAKQRGWKLEKIPAGSFTLASYTASPHVHAERLTVYLEGDGMAWISSSQPSLDPTPVKPVGLELALRHPGSAAAYLARPCQFVRDGDQCRVAYWTTRRFAPEVIASTSTAIDYLKSQAGAKELELIGYSGGGAIAALVAARRQDVARLVTVAGNLDHAAWTTLHRATPLAYSLNPADAWQSLQTIPQLHFVGERDDNITPALVQSYLARFPDRRNIRMQIVKDYDHACCWAQNWGMLLTDGRQ